MNPIIIVVIVLVFGGSYFYAFMLHKRGKNSIKEYESPNMVAKSEEFQEELLQRIYSPLAKRFPHEKIDAFTECAYITNLTSKTKSTLFTGLKVLGWGLIGVRARYTQAANATYLVLVGEDIHYILFIEGEQSDFFMITSSQLKRAKITPLSNVDKTTRMLATTGNKVSNKLVFEKDGKNIEIIFFDRVTNGTQGIPLSDSSSSITDILGKGRVMGIRFKERLLNQHPNLKH